MTSEYSIMTKLQQSISTYLWSKKLRWSGAMKSLKIGYIADKLMYLGWPRKS